MPQAYTAEYSVVYACGAIVAEDKLFIYYGGADTVVCVAAADLNSFLKSLKLSQIPKFEFVTSIKY